MNRRAYIRETTRLNRKFEAKYFPIVERAIKGQVNSVAAVVKESGIQVAITFTNNILVSPITKTVRDMYLTIGLQYARRQWRSLQEQKRATRTKSQINVFAEVKSSVKIGATIPNELKGFGFNQAWVDFIKNFLSRFLLEKITFWVSQNTRSVMLTVLNKAVNEGWGIDETVKALDELPLSATQAARIVRTEITRAANTGVMAASSTFEFEQTKEWISAHDLRVRGINPKDHASHVLLDGVTIDYEDYFIDPVNGDRLFQPGDPGGRVLENGEIIPPTLGESTINCRCVAAVVAKIGENGRLIPKINIQ